MLLALRLMALHILGYNAVSISIVGLCDDVVDFEVPYNRAFWNKSLQRKKKAF